MAILAGSVLATVAMWAFGYLSHLPGVMLPGPATLAGLTLVLLIAGRLWGPMPHLVWPLLQVAWPG